MNAGIEISDWILHTLVFIAGIICAILYRQNLGDFFQWLKPSWEETPGRASGKALAAFVFSITLCTMIHRIMTRSPQDPDFSPNQTKLIELCISTLEYLILGLFFTKILAKSNVLSLFLSRFNKNGGNGNMNNGNDNSQVENKKDNESGDENSSGQSPKPTT